MFCWRLPRSRVTNVACRMATTDSTRLAVLVAFLSWAELAPGCRRFIPAELSAVQDERQARLQEYPRRVPILRFPREYSRQSLPDWPSAICPDRAVFQARDVPVGFRSIVIRLKRRAHGCRCQRPYCDSVKLTSICVITSTGSPFNSVGR